MWPVLSHLDPWSCSVFFVVFFLFLFFWQELCLVKPFGFVSFPFNIKMRSSPARSTKKEKNC
jgi:hypothetical protein